MRVALVTESFLPQVNGVANTVRHIVDRLVDTGHEALVVAPGPGLATYRSSRVVRVRSIGLPGYRSFPIGLPDAAVVSELRAFRPDVVHLASPILLGAVGLRAAERLLLPTVAVYQTDVAGFMRHYGIRADAVVGRWVGRIHRRASRTLAPSRASLDQLAAMGVPDAQLWRRGVSLDVFHPRHRVPALHARWAHRRSLDGVDRVVVGYVGRLAAEKQVRRLTELAALPGVHLVVIGDGPERGWLQRHLPDATFTGVLRGEYLAAAFASLDIFLHTGESETFCQTVQEAQASGTPVVAPASGGPLDLVEHGRTGLLYSPHARGSMVRAVERLVDDRLLRARLAAAGTEAVQDRSWSRVVDQLVAEHYRPVVAAHDPVAAA